MLGDLSAETIGFAVYLDAGLSGVAELPCPTNVSTDGSRFHEKRLAGDFQLADLQPTVLKEQQTKANITSEYGCNFMNIDPSTNYITVFRSFYGIQA